MLSMSILKYFAFLKVLFSSRIIIVNSIDLKNCSGKLRIF